MSRKGKTAFLVMLLGCLSKNLYDESQMINFLSILRFVDIYEEIKTEKWSDHVFNERIFYVFTV